MLPPLCVDSTLAGAFSACNPITTKAPAAIAVKGAPSVLFDPTDEQTEKLVAHLVKVWPPEGTRQDTHMSLAGALACMGYSEMWVKLVIQAITLATGNNDRKATERAQMVKATFEKLKEDKPIKAWGKFCDTVGEQNAAPILTLLGQKDSDCPSREVPARCNETPICHRLLGQRSRACKLPCRRFLCHRYRQPHRRRARLIQNLGRFQLRAVRGHGLAVVGCTHRARSCVGYRLRAKRTRV